MNSTTSSEDIAEQLGNTRAVAEKHYIAPPAMTEAGAEVLDTINPRRDRGVSGQ